MLHHPAKGTPGFEYATFQANEDPVLRLTIYTPADPTRPGRPNEPDTGPTGVSTDE